MIVSASIALVGDVSFLLTSQAKSFLHPSLFFLCSELSRSVGIQFHRSSAVICTIAGKDGTIFGVVMLVCRITGSVIAIVVGFSRKRDFSFLIPFKRLDVVVQLYAEHSEFIEFLRLLQIREK